MHYSLPKTNGISALVEDELDNFMVVANATSQGFERLFEKLTVMFAFQFQHYMFI